MVYKNGNIFLDFEFQKALESYSIQRQPAGVKTLDANVLLQIMNLTTGDKHGMITLKELDEYDELDTVINGCCFIVQSHTKQPER